MEHNLDIRGLADAPNAHQGDNFLILAIVMVT